MLRFDHLAVSAETLADGVAYVEQALGLALAGGGQHPLMATHNRLLGLGDLYLEVIAADPDAPRPAHPRWFDLDRFTGPPRLTTWICGCNDLDAALQASPPGAGQPVALSRGEFRWRMAVPADGILPFDSCFPALIQWQGPAHPAPRLPDAGVRLRWFEIAHPQAEALRAALADRFADPRVQIVPGPTRAMRAEFDTPHGRRALS